MLSELAATVGKLRNPRFKLHRSAQMNNVLLEAFVMIGYDNVKQSVEFFFGLNDGVIWYTLTTIYSDKKSNYTNCMRAWLN